MSWGMFGLYFMVASLSIAQAVSTLANLKRHDDALSMLNGIDAKVTVARMQLDVLTTTKGGCQNGKN